MKITLLGAGLVGLPMAHDLAKEESFSLRVADISQERLNQIEERTGIEKVRADLSDQDKVRALVGDADIVLSAVPGHMGFRTLQTIIEEGKDAVDIAFFPEDLFLLDELAKEKGVTVISDIGVAPGMSHILSAFSTRKLDKTDKIRIYVGGLPITRQLPFEYKAGFSPIDVIEEYTRPARYVRDGMLIEMPALSEPEFLDFQGIGTLEAFNSDGLRSLIRTLPCPDMAEKTLRYPGHIEKIKLLRDIGLFSNESINIKGTSIRPIDLATALLFPMWQLGDDEDLTVMQIITEGRSAGKKIRITWELLDHYDRDSGVHSMARTTGYTATAVVRLLAKGMYQKKGISPPEYLAEDEKCVNFILERLEERGVIYRETVNEIF